MLRERRFPRPSPGSRARFRRLSRLPPVRPRHGASARSKPDSNCRFLRAHLIPQAAQGHPSYSRIRLTRWRCRGRGCKMVCFEKRSAELSTEVKTTTCYMCACRCGIRVHLRDGEVRYIDGNPDHPLNQGVICAKGASGIMKQYSPARLTRPLKRRAGAERGAGDFEEIGWVETFSILAERLGKIRPTDPKKFALFTGRDQMQALTGLFARQFGTPNYAAHGGFCSVNMAAGMIYTIGGSFWEFGGPDLERAKLF